MIATTPALLISPDGEVEELMLDSRRAAQMRVISIYVENPSTHPLGRRAVVHAGQDGASVNDVARQAWMSITGGSRPPVLRGAVVITGAPDRAGDFAALSESIAGVVWHAGELHISSAKMPISVSALQHQGGRNHQCDAYAIKRDKVSGRWAFVVLDGIGDRLKVRNFVRRFAPRIARDAAEHGDPARALAAAREQAKDEIHGGYDAATDPSAAAVVAVVDRRSPLIHVAWCGDARAYRLTPIGGTQYLTQDHNYAQELRSKGRTPGPYDRNFLTSCLTTGPIDTAAVERLRTPRLLLCTDGVYAPLQEKGQDISGVLDVAEDAKDAVAMFVGDAIAATSHDSPDNATALVVDIDITLV